MKKLLTILFTLSLTTFAFGGWSDWKPIPGGVIQGEPSVVITKNGVIHVMARGTDDALWYTRTVDAGKSWNKWQKVGGVITGSPSCVETTPNAIDCYVRNSLNGLSQIYRDNYGYWSNWIDQGGQVMFGLAAMAPSESQRKIVSIALDGSIAQKQWGQPLGWSPWGTTMAWSKNDPAHFRPGTQTLIGCGTDPGTTTDWVDSKGNAQAFDNFSHACVFKKMDGSVFISHAQEEYSTGVKFFDVQVPGGMYAKPSARLFNVGRDVEVFYVAKSDKQMKRGVFNTKTASWSTVPVNIGNGTFTDGAGCASGPGKGKINTACMGRGTDGAVWYSFRTPGEDAPKSNEFPQPPDEPKTGKVLFNAGNAGTDINAMYNRPSGSPGSPLKVNVSDAKECFASGSCMFNLGVLLVRKSAAAEKSFEVSMTNRKKLASGKLVTYASNGKFAKGVKVAAASVAVELNVGQTTPVTVTVGSETFTVYVNVVK